MKTAISLPDPVFEAVTMRAAALGMSRSEFLSVAAQRYLRDLDDAALTGRIDSVLERIALAEDESSRFAMEAGRALLEREDW
ncbi:ribbon-helix-helix protein, CopG family [Demequina sp. SYSU T00192]|uniref:Ribbon-helix-helix protein, CopG family n=1 Tax=Demequina litoralis TaxID=3051660 RepID=A0ABT8G7A7_9MICO|nr:ribbon-helix-helix protein, CopG family [Demequina sp. SYSU T00192]MDN4475033.1 ribbon-helix-helix protein, CopG family [Demequina sp. SYSU T00192]